MRPTIPVFLAAATTLLTHAKPPAQRGHLTAGALAITNVRVVPMTRDTVLRDVTVLVRNGRMAGAPTRVAAATSRCATVS